MAPADRSVEEQNTRTLRRAVLWVVLSLAIIFGVYQLAEHLWLRRVDMGTLHTLHILRGLLAALVAASLVAWSFRKSPPRFLESRAAGESIVPTESDRTVHFARWFIQMRWAAVVVCFALTLFAVNVFRYLPNEVWWPLLATDALLAASNAIYLFLLRRKKLRYLLFAQALTDLLFLHTLLHFSGGIENPLSLLALLHVVIAGIMLKPRLCAAVAAAAILLFTALAFAEWGDVVPHYTLQVFPHIDAEELHAAHETPYVVTRVALHAVVIALVAYFVTALAQWGRRHEEAAARMTERALRDHQMLERALETTETALCVVDHDLRNCWSNARWREWFPPCGPAGCLPPFLVEGDRAPVPSAFQDGSVRVLETEGPALARVVRNGDFRWKDGAMQFTVGPVRESGTVAQIVVLAQDVTERRRAHTQLLKAGKLAAIGELAGHVAHEVNNPIAVISGKARLLLSDRRSEMSAKVAGEVEKIVDLSHRVARIAQGLLQYYRPSVGARAGIDLAVPVRRALALVEQRARSCGVRIEDGFAAARAEVVGNANELEQVFLNLFLNALDAMPQGGVLRVAPARARLADGASALAVLVEDSGTGIPPEIRERIFEPFFTTKAEGRGTGLGLGICLGIVRSHGGEIQVDGTTGEGTRFTVKLPTGETR